MAPRKPPKYLTSPTSGREVRIAADPAGGNKLCPVWKLDRFDGEGPWGHSGVPLEEIVQEILPKLQFFESMTWGEIEAKQKIHHSVRVSRIIPQAQRRLRELRLDDIDELFRFRLSGERRLWGIRTTNVMQILWWDPGHEVCPSELKHT